MLAQTKSAHMHKRCVSAGVLDLFDVHDTGSDRDRMGHVVRGLLGFWWCHSHTGADAESAQGHGHRARLLLPVLCSI